MITDQRLITIRANQSELTQMFLRKAGNSIKNNYGKYQS